MEEDEIQGWPAECGFPASLFPGPEGLPAPALVLLLWPRHQDDFAHILLLLQLPHGIRHLERKTRLLPVPSSPSREPA